jgi:hypothetical protein
MKPETAVEQEETEGTEAFAFLDFGFVWDFGFRIFGFRRNLLFAREVLK